MVDEDARIRYHITRFFGHTLDTPVIHILLGTLFLVFVLVCYGVIYRETLGQQDTRQLMRVCIHACIWSVALLSIVFIATESGIAPATALSTIFWMYAKFMSLLLGAVGFLGAIVLWLLRRVDDTLDG